MDPFAECGPQPMRRKVKPWILGLNVSILSIGDDETCCRSISRNFERNGHSLSNFLDKMS